MNQLSHRQDQSNPIDLRDLHDSYKTTYPLLGKGAKGGKLLIQTSRPYNIAHRGSNGEIPEETAAAYLRAIEEGADFIETDVLSTKDGVLICFHDVILDETTDVASLKEFDDRNRTYEVKWPGGKRFEDKVVDTLKKYGYGGSYLSKKWSKRPLFIQSFAPSSLVYISDLTDSPKVLLIDDVTVLTEDTNQTYAEITSDVYFNYIKQYVVGIGPWKDTVVPVSNSYIQAPTDLVKRAHAHNLQVHPYTYRNENEFLHLNFSQDPYKEYEYWINEIGVDGLFTDFTGSLHNYQEWTSPLSETSKSPRQLLSQIASLVHPYAKA
ncbi:hypothetical protein Bca4012_038737 [Brassica carinata]